MTPTKSTALASASSMANSPAASERALNDATNNQDVQQSLLSQAKELRQQYQGVSLDEEATILMQFQRAYQATSKFLSVLDQLTENAINILR